MSTTNVYTFTTGKALSQAPTPAVSEFDHYPWWAFEEYPVAPDYVSGNAAGNAAALAFLKYLQSGHRSSQGTLQCIALDFARELKAARSEGEIAAIQGKMVGMFTTLEEWLVFAVKQGTTPALKNATEATLRATLQDAAEGAPLTRLNTRAKAKKSEATRKAARERRDKQSAGSASQTI